MPQQHELSQAQIEAFTARVFDDFTAFVEEIWNDRGLHGIAPLGPIERDIIDYTANGPKRRVILAPRGSGKTHLSVATMVCWRLFRDPERKCIIVSKSATEAKKTVRIIRLWLDHIWFLNHLAPRKGKDADNSTQFEVSACQPGRQPSLTAIGIEGQLPGNRADSIFADDVETPQNTVTLEAREALNQQVSEFVNILYPSSVGKPGGRVDPSELIVVGTFQHEESLYLKFAARQYDLRTWTMEYPGPDEKQLNLAPIIKARMAEGLARAGDPTMPGRFGTEEINERKAEGRRSWLMQNQLCSDLGETNRYPLRLSDLIIVDDINTFKAPITISWGTRDHNGSTAIEDIDNLGFQGDHLHRPVQIDQDLAPFTGTRMRIDPAGRGDDRVGVAIASHLAGYLWLKYCRGLAGGYSRENLARLCLLARDHDVRHIVVEDNWGGGMFTELMTPVLRSFFLTAGSDPNRPLGWTCSIEDIHSTGQKELRIIDALEPVTSTHRLVTSRSVITPERGPTSGGVENQLQYQLTRITRQNGALKEDGAIDALAGVVKDWQNVLRADPAHAAVRAKQRTIDDEIKAMRKLRGLHTPETGWLTRR